jgi:hypothetical protein
MHTPHGMTRSGNLDFRNAIKADLDRNISDSASVYSPSRHHYPHFSSLNRFALSVSTMKSASRCNALLTDAIPFHEVKASQSDGDGSFKLSLCECETFSDGDVMNRHEATISVSASRLSTLKRK